MINRVKCFTEVSVDDICVKIIFETLYYEEKLLGAKLVVVNAFHKTVLTR